MKIPHPRSDCGWNELHHARFGARLTGPLVDAGLVATYFPERRANLPVANWPQLKNVAFVGMTVYDRRTMTAARILILLLLTPVVLPAQTSGVSLADTQRRTLTSGRIGQRYELLVSLPEGYAKSGQSYPVLYVLDGWHFPLMAFIQENNVYSKRMRPVIIVNVSHGATDHNLLYTLMISLASVVPRGFIQPVAAA
jgi:hypothetical protein